MPRSYFGSAKDRFTGRPLGLVHVRLSATPRIDLDQLLVGDESKMRRLFPYVRWLAALEKGRLLLVPDSHAPQFVRHVLLVVICACFAQVMARSTSSL